MLSNLVHASRSYRRFDQKTPISMTDLLDLVGLARLCPSAGNKQPLRFVLCNDPADNARIFACLKWAAYLSDWGGPKEGEQPGAYIVLLNTDKSWELAKIDQGIVAQTMMLGAVEKGYGGCILGAIDREKLRSVLGLENDGLEICLVLALGKPVEDVRVVDLPAEGSIRYFRDESGVHYVPKRSLDELILQQRG
ncbi:MAG: nitroreductase family protein [Desulfovibrionales bacterium]|nr:nitroreductase family protein [Desulfovibrionales bacterium]